MLPCEKPVSEQTLGEITNCGWDTLRGAFSGVVSHPGGATVTEWIITTLAILALLFFLVSLIPRRL
ncbi:MAG: hypothetical protein WBQ53_15270 [Methylocystis sp.]|jgi:hypothetical protein